MRQSNLILSNAAIIWACRVFLLVPQVILVPYLIRTIGEAGYGAYVLVWSLLMSISQLEQSLQQGVVKYSAAFIAGNRIDDVNKIVSSSFVYSLLLAVVAAGGILIIARIGDTTGDLEGLLYIISLLVLFIIPLTPYIAVIQSRQRYYVGVIAETISKYVSLAVIVLWFTLMTSSVEALIIIMASMLLLSRIAQVPVAYRLLPGLQNHPRLFERGAFSLIVAFGSTVVLLSLCNLVNTTGVRWLMGLLTSTSFVAHLAIMLMPCVLLSQIVHAMTITIMPATSAYQATGNSHMLSELLLRSMRYTAIIVLAAMLVAIILIGDILMLWVGPEYIFLAPYMLTLFASTALLMTISSAHHMLKGLGKLKITVFIALVGKVLVPLSLTIGVFIVLHKPYLAVVVGLATGNFVGAILHLAFAMKAIHVGFQEVLTRVYAHSIFLAAPIGGLAITIVSYGDIERVWGRASVAFMAVVLFLSLFYFLAATLAERQHANEIVGLFLTRLRKLGWMRSRSESTRL